MLIAAIWRQHHNASTIRPGTNFLWWPGKTIRPSEVFQVQPSGTVAKGFALDRTSKLEVRYQMPEIVKIARVAADTPFSVAGRTS